MFKRLIIACCLFTTPLLAFKAQHFTLANGKKISLATGTPSIQRRCKSIRTPHDHDEFATALEQANNSGCHIVAIAFREASPHVHEDITGWAVDFLLHQAQSVDEIIFTFPPTSLLGNSFSPAPWFRVYWITILERINHLSSRDAVRQVDISILRQNIEQITTTTCALGGAILYLAIKFFRA